MFWRPFTESTDSTSIDAYTGARLTLFGHCTVVFVYVWRRGGGACIYGGCVLCVGRRQLTDRLNRDYRGDPAVDECHTTVPRGSRLCSVR